MSPPTRRRGLKLCKFSFHSHHLAVASHAEAWIETYNLAGTHKHAPVASHAEAWIETLLILSKTETRPVASHAEAWIETGQRGGFHQHASVASHAEAWIETCDGGVKLMGIKSRLPRGGVD